MKKQNSNLTKKASRLYLNHLGQTTYASFFSPFKSFLIEAQEKLGLNKLLAISCLFFLFTSFATHAKTFTSVGNGSWGSSSTWDQNGTPDVNNWPNDKVIINHAVTGGNVTMNGASSRITINSGGSLTLTGTLNVKSSGQVHVNAGGSLTATNIYLNTSGTGNLNGTITANNTMHLDGAFVGSPTIVVGGYLLAGAAGKVHDFTNLSLTVGGNMTVQNSKLKWDVGSVTVGGNFLLMGTGDVDVPEGGSLDISGTLSVSNALFIGGPTGSGSGGIVTWDVGNVVLSGNNKGLNRCPLPYASPFDLKTCTQALAGDVTNPIITLTGNASETVAVGATYTDAGATANDDTDGDLTSSIVTTNNVDANTVGSYTVTYNVSDAAGNAATAVVRSVDVVDVTPPVITLAGNATENVSVGDTYTDAGATATDGTDGDLTGNIVTSSNVDANTIGAYTVSYNVNDAAGNLATEVVRAVNVVDGTPPVITLTGNASESITVGDTYSDAGATATDDLDGDLTGSIVTSSNVNQNAAGSYTVTYNVSDGAGNAAPEVTRDVTVVAQCSLTFSEVASSIGLSDVDDNWSVAWGDFNNDCYEDLFIASYDPLNPNLLYKNNGDGTFTKMGASAGEIVTKIGDYVAGSWGDYDNDGDLDIAISGNLATSSEIYRNNGDETFTSITAASIGDDNSYAHGISFVDHNNDGYLDLYITNYFSTGFSHFFTNDGSGSFVREETSSLANIASSSVSSSWADYDNDGDQDVFISNTNNEKNFLYRNEGNGVFTKITTGAIVNDAHSSVGASWGDYNNDGYIDLFVSNANQDNVLYTNNGGTSFTKVTSGVIVTDGGHSHGSAWIDFDNDGDLDLHVSNDQSTVDFLYENDGSGTFTRSTLLDSYTLNSMGAGWADYDNDGDLDLAVANRSSQVNALFNNIQTGACSNNSLTIKLNGDGNGIGARLSAKATVNSTALWQYRQVAGQTGGGVGGQSSLKTTFGFGDATVIDSLVIYWPNGATTVLTALDLSVVSTTCYEVAMPSTATVSGKAYYDLNGDCVKDAGESYVSNIQIRNAETDVLTATNDQGAYTFNVGTGTYSLSMEAHDLWAVTSGCPTSLSVATTIGGTYTDNDFSIQPNCSLPDLDASITSTAQRIGFHNAVSLVVANNGGAKATNVVVTMTMGEEVVFISSSPSPDVVAGGVLTWNIAEMDLNEMLRIDIVDSVKIGTAADESISFCSTMDADEDLCELSEVCITETSVGSFDPNDMVLMNPGYGDRHMIDRGEFVSYKIRFQNVGNWYATNVVLTDTLSAYINPSSIYNIKATHDYTWSVDGNGILTVKFLGIELPDSTRDEVGSHGAFEFSAYLKSDAPNSALIEGKAGIVFDFNDPVETNTVFNWLEDLDALVAQSNIELISYPNPSSSSVTLGLMNNGDYLVPILITEVKIVGLNSSFISKLSILDQQNGSENSSIPQAFRAASPVVSEDVLNPKINITNLPNGVYIIFARDEYGNQYRVKQVIRN